MTIKERRIGMRGWVVLLVLVIAAGNAMAQRYIDRGGKASFYSSAPLEDIEAHTDQAVALLDVGTGEIVASVLMRSFDFRKALMQEHFNESFIESHKFPKATFKGTICNPGEVTWTRDGTYPLGVRGEMTIHGVTQPLEIVAEAVVRDGLITATARFPLRVKDFDIEIPRLVTDNIAEVVDVSVSFTLKPM